VLSVVIHIKLLAFLQRHKFNECSYDIYFYAIVTRGALWEVMSVSPYANPNVTSMDFDETWYGGGGPCLH
jgi:hypothetical protein